MSIPTTGETFSKLLEHLRLAQEDAAMMAHLINASGTKKDNLLAKGWLGIEELLKRMCTQVTKLAMGRMQ